MVQQAGACKNIADEGVIYDQIFAVLLTQKHVYSHRKFLINRRKNSCSNTNLIIRCLMPIRIRWLPDADPDTMGMDRRCFIRLSALFAGGMAAFGGLVGCSGQEEPAVLTGIPEKDGTRIVRVGCPAHNCGGRCVLKLHVKEGKILTRLPPSPVPSRPPEISDEAGGQARRSKI